MIIPKHPIDDDELLRLAAENPELRIEREPDGSLTVSPPSSFRNGVRAAEAVRQLIAWAAGRGHVAGADGGFRMPDTSVRAADASWISLERWNALSDEQREKFATLPEVVIEIVSASDSYIAQRRKTQRYVEQGALYAVIIDPRTRTIEEFGTALDDLALDFDRIIDAGR